MTTKLPAIAIVLILNAAVGTAQECRLDGSWAKAIRQVAEGIISADNKREISRVLSYYAEDAMLKPPNEAPVKGLATIRARYETLFANFTPQIQGRIDEICYTHRAGFVRGYNGGQLVPNSGGETLKLDDTYLMLLRRSRNGKWRITHLSWHRGPAPPPAEEN